MRDLFFLGDDELHTIEQLWEQGVSRSEIAETIGIKTRQLETLKASGRIRVSKRQGQGGGQSGRPPSPAEIRKACQEVQSQWDSFTESERRAGSGNIFTDNAMRLDGERLGKWHYEQTKIHPLKGRIT